MRFLRKTITGFGENKLPDPHATAAFALVKGIDAARQIKFPHPFKLGVVFFRVKLIGNLAEPVAPCDQGSGIVQSRVKVRCFDFKVGILGGFDNFVHRRNISPREDVSGIYPPGKI